MAKRKQHVTVRPKSGLNGGDQVKINGHVYSLTQGPPTARQMHDAEYDRAMDRRSLRYRSKRIDEC